MRPRAVCCPTLDSADAQETGPQQALPAPGKTPVGVQGGRPTEKQDDIKEPGCCGGCVIL